MTYEQEIHQKDVCNNQNVYTRKNALSYNTIIRLYLGMVRKTVIFEKTYLSRQSKLSKQMYPLMEEAKNKLYNYYDGFLRLFLHKESDPYLKALISSKE